jgi:hypothetical protein
MYSAMSSGLLIALHRLLRAATVSQGLPPIGGGNKGTQNVMRKTWWEMLGNWVGGVRECFFWETMSGLAVSRSGKGRENLWPGGRCEESRDWIIMVRSVGRGGWILFGPYVNRDLG